MKKIIAKRVRHSLYINLLLNLNLIETTQTPTLIHPALSLPTLLLVFESSSAKNAEINHMEQGKGRVFFRTTITISMSYKHAGKQYFQDSNAQTFQSV